MGKTKYTVRDDITQGQLEQWAAFFTDTQKWSAHTSLYHGAIVRGAIKAGWIEGLEDPAVVSDWTPKETKALALQIDKRYEEMTTIDPN